MALIMLGFKSYTMSGRTNKTCVGGSQLQTGAWDRKQQQETDMHWRVQNLQCVSDVLAAKEGNGEPGPWQATQPLPKYNQVAARQVTSMPARMCCSCSVVKIEASVLLLVLVDLRLRTANSTTSICCFKFKKSRRQYSRIKLLTKDLGCPPITTAREFPLCDFALLHAATPIVFLVPFGWKQVLVAALAFSDPWHGTSKRTSHHLKKQR